MIIIINLIKYGPIQAVIALIFVLILLPQTITASFAQVKTNIAFQNAHMEYLKTEYYTEDYIPCDENKIAAFEIEQAIEDGVKYNEVAFIGTHNSYQIEATEEFLKLYNAVDVVTFGIIDGETADFTMDTLTEQMQLGIRNFEIDIETVVTDDEIGFVVSHSPLLDNTSSCYDFEKALEEIKMWSDANPNHLPISIIIEPKEFLLPISGMRNFNLEYANAFDDLLREKLGETLLTPSEMMGEYASLKEMREADGWLPLEDTLGKVLVLMHDTAVTEDYINQDVSIKSQAMFPMLRFDDRNETYTSFIICNDPEDALENKPEAIDKCNLIVRTRADSYPTFSDERYELANQCGSQIISTDYPFRAGENKNHVYSFGGYTVKLVK